MEKLSDTIERILIFLGALYYLFVFPHGAYGDGYVRWVALEALLQKGELIVHKYSMLGPIFAAPFYYLGLLVKTPHWWVSRFNAFVFLFFIFSLALFFKKYFPPSARRRFILLLMTATMFPKHVTDFYAEVFSVSMACLGLTILNQKKDFLGILGLSLSIVNTPASFLGAALSSSYVAWLRKQWRYIFVLLLAGTLFFMENYIRFGSALNHIYFNEEIISKNPLPYSSVNGFSNPLLFGLLSVFLSFGKGILFYSPGLLLALHTLKFLPEKLKELQISWLIYLLGLVFIYAKWFAWTGDWYWGPRFFLFSSLPATLALWIFLERKGRSIGENFSLVCVATMAVWVGVNGVSFGQNNMELCGANEGQLLALCWYTPEFSALWRPFIAEKALHGKQIAFLIYFFLVYVFLFGKVWCELFIQSFTLLKYFLAEKSWRTGWKF